MTDKHLLLIDDVAREMTATDPAPDFHARVVHRISEERQRAPVSGWMIGMRVAVATAAVAAVIMVARQTDVGRQAPASPMARAAAPVTAPAAPVTPEAATIAPIPRVASAAPDPAAQRRASELAEWHGRAIPALEDLKPLGVRDIQPGGLSISQLSVTPLEIAPITIAPIGGEGGR